MRIILIIFSIFSLSILFGKKIHIITTNDLHGVISPQKAYFMNPNFPPDILGWAAYSQYVNDLRDELKSKGENLLILDGGNFFQGSPVGLVDGGKSIIEWMNLIGYDAVTIGPDDFLLGLDNISELAELADFPILAANINFKSTKPYTIRNIEDIKIGIIGIIPSNLNELVIESNIQNINLKKEIPTLNKMVKEVKELGADIIIVLSSNGIPWNREREYEKFISNVSRFDSKLDDINALELGYFAESVDLIVAGGNSKGYPTIWYDKNSHVFITQNYGNGTEFGHLILETEDNKLSNIYPATSGRIGQTLLADNFNADYETLTLLRDLESRAIFQLESKNNTYNKNHLMTNLPVNKDRWKCPNLDIIDELEVVTWNCEFFPKANDSTIYALAEIIIKLNPDLIGFQEIRKRGWFDDLMIYLPDYDYAIAMQSSFMDNAFIYKKDRLRLLNQYEPFANNDYNFAGRPPLQCDFLYDFNGKNIEFTAINIHMKCCDSGLKRRKRASQMLHKYVDKLYNKNKNIIVLGDWNDDLLDKEGEHCFNSFFNDDRMYFANNKILNDISQVSYPKEPFMSFLDHILITEQFLNSKIDYRVMTIPIDEYMGGFNVYETYISDHKPVMVGIPVK
ncbi:MAG: hypothetical protein CMF96_12585 [Candidatus Marinimicrobia bacterium]|nr:hypothetical protein [Candidatus Neomarinimicrobiota bacterium]